MAAEGEIENVSSLRMASTYQRDLLRRFAGEESVTEASSFGGGGVGEVELSLGLSLGGCFGEPKREKTPVEMGSGVVRSSSISFPPTAPAEASGGLLARTCSLPVESEEERRRKEMQSLKRMEAKRKRSEKRAKERREEDPSISGAGAGAGAGKSAAEIGGKVKAKAKAAVVGKKLGGGKTASQGSIGSQGSSLSGVSDFDSRPSQGGLDVSVLSNSMEARSPSTISSAADNANNKVSLSSPLRISANLSKEEEEPSKRRRIRTVTPNGVKETERNMLEEMPCVSAKSDGPNGKKIEGFLYKYQKGEEVRIMCICHGSFLTPAEFVKHAGGGDVDHPLRHIVVNPNPSAFV